MKISALVLARNEEEMLKDALSSLSFCDEIIILDQNSSDKTKEIAQKFSDKVFETEEERFDINRNFLAAKAKSKWLLYLDPDERLDSKNIEEIKQAVKKENISAFYFPRKNIILGRWFKHSGFWPDYVPRLFQKDQFECWEGEVHESPKFKGPSTYLKKPIVHLSGRSLNHMFLKSIRWARIEANLYYNGENSKVTIPKVVKSMVFEFVRRYFLKKGLLDGTVGFIESIYQSLHQAMVLTYLWELQNNIKYPKEIENE